MKTLLNSADIFYLMNQQEKLDKDIRAKKGISVLDWKYKLVKNQEIALNVEINEFINECHDIWKYWKDKPVDKNRIIEEAVDVIHFIILNENNGTVSFSRNSEFMTKNLKRYSDKNNLSIKTPLQAIYNLQDTKYNSNTEILFLVLYILDHYDFTAKDIMDSYKEKNKINFERMKTGY